MHTVAYVHAVTGLHDLTDLIVNYLCVLACMQGATYALAGTLLVNLCACLFIGLFL